MNNTSKHHTRSPFLKQVAHDLYQRYGTSISDITIVFPGKRVSLFFLKYLAEITGKVMWAPYCLTIQELMQQASGKRLTDQLPLIFDLHTVYQQEMQRTERFDDFYFWGEMLLSDFDDIDKYLVNAEDLFQNLSLIKTYENLYNYLNESQLKSIKQFWSSFSNDASGEMQEKFISVWSVLFPVYKNFRDHLIQSNRAYDGMIYRMVAERIRDNETIDLSSSKLAFVGFNALNACERKLFQYLKVQKRADFYWDYTPSFVEDEMHQAGFFLRENIRQFPPPTSWQEHEKEAQNNNIQVFATGSDIAQVKLAGKSLQELSQEKEINEETALILADESLLPQVLYALPVDMPNVNITMGFPLFLSQAYSFMDALFTLQQFQKKHENEVYYYFKHGIHVLQHPFVLHAHQDEIEKFIQEMKQQNQVYISVAEIPDNLLLKTIFTSPTAIIPWFKEIITLLMKDLKSRDPKEADTWLELEFLFHIYTAFNQIDEQLRKKNLNLTMRTLRRMIHRVIGNIKIPFTGEPLSGLQIMGLLETRAVDFKNIILLSFNEGIYPKTSASPSYIPYNLRKGFGLPTLEHQDSIFAYYFYRLMQRAELVQIFYNTKADGLNSGERSRFLHQIIYQEFYDLKDQKIAIPLSNKAPQPIDIHQTDETIDILKKYTPGNGMFLSPSALNIYLDCSLKFYYKYIAGIPEPEELSEEVDPAVFGNILHDSMEAVYRSTKTELIDEKDIQKMLSQPAFVQDIVNHAFKENYERGSGLSGSGSNIIVKEVIVSFIRQILNVDMKNTPFEIIEMENQHQLSITVSSHPEVTEILIGGKIDRVDKMNGKVRIIDYKTGKADHLFSDIPSLFAKEHFHRNKAVFQTFFYSLLYDSAAHATIQPGLYPMKNIFNENFDYQIFMKEKSMKMAVHDFNEVKMEYRENLQNLINAIYSRDTVFEKTREQRFCQYCSYRDMCRR